MQKNLKKGDPIRTIDKDFQTSIGLVKKGSIGYVLGYLNDKLNRVHVQIHGPDVTLFVGEQFIEYHKPPEDEYR